MEASTGIEPVYTDLQSIGLPNKNKAVGAKKYQDKAGTQHEPDTPIKNNLTKENAGAAATASVVNDRETIQKSQRKVTPKRPDTSIAGNIPSDIKRLSKAIGYALWLDTHSAWHGLTIILLARMTEKQRVALAYASLKSLNEENAYLTSSVALFGVLEGEVLR